MCIDEVVKLAKAEILADIASGIVPADVATFSELHDHVDANGYGGAFEALDSVERDANDDIPEGFMTFWNRVRSASTGLAFCWN